MAAGASEDEISDLKRKRDEAIAREKARRAARLAETEVTISDNFSLGNLFTGKEKRENEKANKSRTRDYSIDEWNELSASNKEWNTNREGEVQLDRRGNAQVFSDGNERATMKLVKTATALDPYENSEFVSNNPETAAKLYIKRENQKTGKNEYSYKKVGDRILVQRNGYPDFWIDKD